MSPWLYIFADKQIRWPTFLSYMQTIKVVPRESYTNILNLGVSLKVLYSYPLLLDTKKHLKT